MVGRLLRLQLGLLAAGAILAGSATADVLYVGDSLGVGTAPYLKQRLGGTKLDVDAEIGRPSATGVDILASKISSADDVVVFDLGTNDDPASPATLASDLAQARRIAGDRCLVIATLNRPPLNGVSVAGLNRAVTSFAANDPNVELVDWHAAAQSDPGLLVDGVHTDGQGYALRAGLFADAIGSCGSFGGPIGGSSSNTSSPPAADLPPPASAGSNRGHRGAPAPTAEHRDKPSLPPGVQELATALGKAIATGSDFG